MLGLIACLIIGVFLGVAQNRSRANDQYDHTSRFLTPVFSAPAGLLHRNINAASDFFAGIGAAGRLKEENRRLQQMAAAVSLYQGRVDDLQAHVKSLQNLLNVNTQQRQRVSAQVIGYAPYESRITLSVGSNQGVEPGQAVVSGEGLLAVVQTVGGNTCQANLITSPNQSVGAVVVGYDGITALSHRLLGLVHGDTETSLILETTDVNSDIQLNSKIYTSGVSTTIPGGLYIGFVLSQQEKSEFGQRVIKVEANARVGDAREVFVLK